MYFDYFYIHLPNKKYNYYKIYKYYNFFYVGKKSLAANLYFFFKKLFFIKFDIIFKIFIF